MKPPDSENPGARAEVRVLPMAQALAALGFLHSGDGVFELCIIGPKTPKSNLWEGYASGKKPIVAGWFKDPAAAAKLAVQIDAEGIYTTLNPCQQALLARADHRLKAHVDRTADQHVTGMRNLLVDIDPKRPTGISATDAEHAAALEMAQVVKADLAKEKWPEPLVGDSGNGAHLIYSLDLSNDQESVALVKAVLGALALRYTDELARRKLEIDLKVFNPARLTKLYGTWTRKGDNTPARPHRLAQIVSLPEARNPIPLEVLKKLAATVQGEGAQGKDSGTKEGQFDLEAYLRHYDVEVVKVKPHKGGFLYCLKECIFDSSHSDNEAAIGQTAEGKLFFQCFHNSCKGRTWTEARQKISGDAKLTEFIIIVAGVTDAGKTAYLLNIALLNRDKLRVNYFSLEMPEQELRKRLERFEEVGLIDKMDEWRKVNFKERSHNFHQVIKSDEVNIVDYLEITKEFWQVADQISEIYNKLNKGVAIIALQKKIGQEYGLGGHFSAFRARLYIAMDKNELRVVKAKNWNDLVTGNPANKVYGYKLLKGAKFIPWEK